MRFSLNAFSGSIHLGLLPAGQKQIRGTPSLPTNYRNRERTVHIMAQ